MTTTPGAPPPPTLPPFLAQTREEIHNRFVELEWLQRERIQEGQQNSDPPTRYTRMAGDAATTARNRYLNVEPFALNRVKLKVPDGSNDYINASPIELNCRRFIATQGPKDPTIPHFYRMLASETRDPAVVVMLTQTHEAGREKCSRYFPLSAQDSPLPIPREPDDPEPLDAAVTLLSIRDDGPSRSQLRHMRLRTRIPARRSEGEGEGESEGGGDGGAGETFVERDIYHLLFAGWPDFLVPEGEDRAALLELLRLSASLTSASNPPPDPGSATQSLPAALASVDPANPRIVHCSAGVGRSGTFIALDILLSRLHAGEWDEGGGGGGGDGGGGGGEPICEVVDALRRQRMMMVQGEAQFHFLYEVVREQFEERMRMRREMRGEKGERGGGGGGVRREETVVGDNLGR